MVSRHADRRESSASSPLQIYLQDINDTPLLSADEERELADRVAAGDPYAREHMVKANLRLVVNIARGYLGKGLNLEDLIEEGNLGLMRAVEGFDGMMETRFSTYASYWIKQSIRRSVMNNGKPIRLPAYMVSLLSKWRRATAVLTDRLGRAPTPEEVGKALKLSKKKIGIVSKAMHDPARMAAMAANARKAGNPDAARLLALMVEAIAGGKTIAQFKGERP